MATKGKKSFAGNDNPALAFISSQEPEQAEGTPATTRGNLRQPAAKDTPLQAGTSAHVKTTDAPEGYKANPLFVETKSRRLQLLVQPSIYEALKEGAKAEGRSVNDYVHTILEKAVRG